MLIDTHCHLDFEQFNSDRNDVIERAKESGVNYLINVGTDIKSSQRSVELGLSHKEVFSSVGIHPHCADQANDGAFNAIREMITSEKVVAIGEVGLDYFKCPLSRELQQKTFIKFLEFSGETKLPLIIHNRNAEDDIIGCFDKVNGRTVSGVMHCFSGSRKYLDKVLERNLYVSFACILTFKNAHNVREIAKHVPTDRILLETDSPFLAPAHYRGKRNEPSYIIEARNVLSEILGIPRNDLDRITTENAIRLFGLKIDEKVY